jgi:hypothetical protein
MDLIATPPSRRWTAYPNAGLHGIIPALGAEGEYIERTFPSLVPPPFSGQRVAVASDYGGMQQGSDFESYSFLVVDQKGLPAFHARMAKVRSDILEGRTISFKDRKDAIQQRAMPAFFAAADRLPGLLATILFDRRTRKAPVFQLPRDQVAERGKDAVAGPFAGLTDTVRERMMRIVVCGTTLVAGLAKSNQEILWHTDNDDTVANANIAKLFGIAVAALRDRLQPGTVSRVKVATPLTKMSPAVLLKMEDLLAVPDFAAGTMSAAFTASQRAGRDIGSSLIQLLPADCPSDVRAVSAWLADDRWPLKRWLLVLKQLPGDGKWALGSVRLHRFASMRP